MTAPRNRRGVALIAALLLISFIALLITGSLSAFLWLRVARSLDARPSALRYTRLGIVLVPVSIAASLAALHL